VINDQMEVRLARTLLTVLTETYYSSCA
jgi:hypothetical protein